MHAARDTTPITSLTTVHVRAAGGSAGGTRRLLARWALLQPLWVLDDLPLARNLYAHAGAEKTLRIAFRNVVNSSKSHAHIRQCVHRFE